MTCGVAFIQTAALRHLQEGTRHKMDFLGIGPTELLFIGIIALIVLGPAKMMEVSRS